MRGDADPGLGEFRRRIGAILGLGFDEREVGLALALELDEDVLGLVLHRVDLLVLLDQVLQSVDRRAVHGADDIAPAELGLGLFGGAAAAEGGDDDALGAWELAELRRTLGDALRGESPDAERGLLALIFQQFIGGDGGVGALAGADVRDSDGGADRVLGDLFEQWWDFLGESDIHGFAVDGDDDIARAQTGGKCRPAGFH